MKKESNNSKKNSVSKNKNKRKPGELNNKNSKYKQSKASENRKRSRHSWIGVLKVNPQRTKQRKAL